MTVVHLPYPPATNNLFKNIRRGRVKTERYEAWIAKALESLKAQRWEPVRGPFRVQVLATRPDRRKRDLDGIIKAPLDLLKTAGVIEDDSLAEEVSFRWRPGEYGAAPLHIVVEAAWAGQ